MATAMSLRQIRSSFRPPTGIPRISPLVRPGTENTCSGPNASPLRCIATVTRFIGFSHRGSLSSRPRCLFMARVPASMPNKYRVPG